MGDEELGPVGAELRRKREEAYVYVSKLADHATTLPTVSAGYLYAVLEMASETEKFRGLLATMNRAYRSMRERKNAEISDLRRRLEEATATIILACELVEVEHPAWVVLDGYDGSDDNPRELLARGFTRSGDGGWYGPDASGMWKAGAP